MPNHMLRLLLGVAAALVLLSGCALDPVERLSEDIDSQDVKVRTDAVLELANLDDERAIELLIEVLESDEKIYDKAGVALVKQGRANVTDEKPDPVLSMLAGVMNNVHLPVPNRARAAWALGEIGDREAIGALRGGAGAKLANTQPAVPVQDAAKAALTKLGDASAGLAFELPMDTFAEGEQVTSLPEVAEVAPPEVEEEEEEEEAEEGQPAKADAAAEAGKGKPAGDKAKAGAASSAKADAAQGKAAGDKKPAAGKEPEKA